MKLIRFTLERNHTRNGFTFFEIAISIALATFCVLTIMVLIPAGLKSQQKARYELLASTKAMEMVEFFGGQPSEERVAEFETPEPWEARPWCYSSTRWDFECRTSRWDSGIMPVPSIIAERLDSDNDEIHSLISQGGQLYYADPRSIPAVDTAFINPMPADESLKLVFAVTGYAQNNAIPVFSYKAWPYRAAYPSPPMDSTYNNIRTTISSSSPFLPINFNFAYGQIVPFEGWTNGTPDATLPGLHDPLMDALNLASIPYQLNYLQYAQHNIAHMQPLQGNLQTAVFNFITDKFSDGCISNPMGNLPVSGFDKTAEYSKYYLAHGVTDFITLGNNYDADFCALCQMAEPSPGESYASQKSNGKAKLRAELALRVQCMRFMSMIMSTFYIYVNGPPGQFAPGPGGYLPSPPIPVVYTPNDAGPPDLTNLANYPMANQPFAPDLVTLDRLRYYHDRCKQFSMRYAASFPYDWGAPRPITRALMTDYPLFEYDMFSPPHTGLIAKTGIPAAQWCPISAQTITSIGMPPSFPGILSNTVFDNTGSPFVPFDGITRKSNPPNIWGDASHFTLTKPFQAAERCRQLVFWSVDWLSYEDSETAPSAPLDASRCPLNGPDNYSLNLYPYTNRISPNLPPQDGLALRNPERQLNFLQDVSNIPTGTNVTAPLQLIELGNVNDNTNLNLLNGIYGADRNHNFLLDRGPIKKSMRIRASLVARFNFYDPRIPITLR